MPELTRGHVLVVDDEEILLALFSEILGHKYTVSTAQSGAEALKLLETTRVDLVLLDIQMPEMDGFEVCAAIQADPTVADIPIIFITATDAEDAEEAALDAGAVPDGGQPGGQRHRRGWPGDGRPNHLWRLDHREHGPGAQPLRREIG